jgi:hypothetical protein
MNDELKPASRFNQLLLIAVLAGFFNLSLPAAPAADSAASTNGMEDQIFQVSHPDWQLSPLDLGQRLDQDAQLGAGLKNHEV